MNAPAPGHTQLPNWIIDLAYLLTGIEYKALVDAVRQTLGWHRDTYEDSTAAIAERIGTTRPRASEALARLDALGLVPCEPGRRNSYVRQLGEPVTPDQLERRIELFQKGTGQEARTVPKKNTDLFQKRTGSVPKRNRSDHDLTHQGGANEVPKERSKEREIKIPPPPTPSTEGDAPAVTPAAPAGGGGGGATLSRNRPAPPSPGAVYLTREGFGASAVETWGHLPVDTLRASVERYKEQGKRPGGIVLAWRVLPPDQEAAEPAPPVTPAPSITTLYNADIDPEQRLRLLRKWGDATTAEEKRRILAQLPAARGAG